MKLSNKIYVNIMNMLNVLSSGQRRQAAPVSGIFLTFCAFKTTLIDRIFGM